VTPTIKSGRFVTVTISGPVAKVHWSRPERRNAIGKEVSAELAESMEQLSSRKSIAVAIFCTQEPPFCAGWDFRDFEGLNDSNREEFFKYGRQLLKCLSAMPQITIAAPAGAVLGFGCSFLSRCDLVIASEDSEFSLPEIRRGMPPATVLPELLSVMSRRDALKWAVTGDTYAATAAMTGGLVTDVVAKDAHSEYVESIAHRIGRWGPELTRETKGLVRQLAAAPEGERTRLGVEAAIRRMRQNAAKG
jgi:methylglutaconyl-CoA hydratase